METANIHTSTHEVFKRTFLKEVTIGAAFDETSLYANKDSLQQFIELNFGVAEDIKESISTINVTSEDYVEKYKFSTNEASVILDSSIYINYEESLCSRLDKLIDFLKILSIQKINSLTITKSNLFVANSNNAFNTWQKALYESFKEEKIREMALISPPNEDPVKLSREGLCEFDGGQIRIPFMIEVNDKNHFSFKMDLIGELKNIMIDDIVTNAKKLNDIIYEIFIDTISDNIIQLMREG